MRKIIGIALCVLLLAACSTTKVGLKYQSADAAKTPMPATSKAVRIAAFVDKRTEPPNWIGAIRGTYGNPIKNLETEQPVATIVQKDFVDALQARGIGESATAQTQIAGVVLKLDCNQVFRREANVEIEIYVVDTATGQSTFKQTYSTSNVDGSVVALDIGIFGSVEVLRALTEKTLRETIDKALDDPALNAALKP
ncbi:MAG: hypothetical protein ACREPX_06990 [Rhodanobacteraceae bacterium]